MKAKKQSNKTSVKEKKVPYQYKPDNMSYDQWQISLRRQFGIKQEFSYKNVGNHKVYSDFEVFNSKTDKKYKAVACFANKQVAIHEVAADSLGSRETTLNYCICALGTNLRKIS